MASSESTTISPQVQRTKARVLQVARELLLELGPVATTYTAITARCGITRQTLYRHWPTREALFADVVLTGPDVAYPVPGGNPRRIVTEFLQSLRAGMKDQATAAALMGLAAQAHRDPVSAAALAAITADRRQALNTLLANTDVQVGAEDFARLCGPVMYQRFLAQTTATDQLIDHTVDAYLTAHAHTA